MSELIQDNLKDFNKVLEHMAKKSVTVTERAILMIVNDFLSALITDDPPVDTGNLRDNWRKEQIKQLLWEIINNTEYAPYVYYANRSIHKGKIENTLNPLIKKARELLFNNLRKVLESGLR